MATNEPAAALPASAPAVARGQAWLESSRPRGPQANQPSPITWAAGWTREMERTPSGRHPDPAYQALLDKQPYTVTLNGLTLEVHRDVFPPDLGRCAQNLARVAAGYAANSALDMGCGSGFIALSLKQAGVANVWAVDIHPPA